MTYSDTMELGIMIETPAAAISDCLAPGRFFSVGTRSDSTPACDRQNPDIEPLSTPTTRRFYGSSVSAKLAANGAWIGICGELAADTR
ncbi:MAG: putative PEP-binding protein [Ruminococcus sp.]